ncbi:MAG TPA: bifunctional UDP-N-acetylglucosamine diphosphorylase/glucosamine-1-phosphate N-acetyltransferase GlmU [Chloroflexota bacterium]
MSEEALVLAAGKGTRMRSRLPKVLHPLAGRPMLTRVLNALARSGFSQPTVVVGYGADDIRAVVGDRCRYVLQAEQLGTGDAARVGLAALPRSTNRLLVVHGDEPLIPADSYREMLNLQDRTGAPVVLLTAEVDDTRGLGRVIRDASGAPLALVQETDLLPEQRSLREVNLGAYVFDAEFLRRSLQQLESHPPKGEYYLTDVVARAAQAVSKGGVPVQSVTLSGKTALLGVNDLLQLEEATREVYRATAQRLMRTGVRIVDSTSVYIADDVDIGADTVIHPFSIISGPTRIGSGCVIGPGSSISASEIGESCTILSSTVENARVDDDVTIGPYAHLRPGSVIGTGAQIGNYAEIKGSTLGPRTKMHHMSYIGDARIGSDVNIGAGTVTCNFDGVSKHRTVIEDGAFIGSDTMLRAPITVGRGAFTGAGSVVVRDVPAYTVVAGVPARVIREVETRERDDGDHNVEAANSEVRSGSET